MKEHEYKKLKQEINRFIDLLKHIEYSLIGFASDECQSFKIEIVDKNEAESIFKAMKSNAMIMLYNLIEACVRLTMKDYYEKFNTSHQSYAQTIEKLRRLWVQNSARICNESNLSQKVFEMIENVMDDEYKISLNFEEDFHLSGNADLRKIKSILENHGIGYNSEEFKNYGGALKSIKDMRNSLAHGNISFEENGKKLTVYDIDKYKDETYLCLEYFIDIVRMSIFCKKELAEGQKTQQRTLRSQRQTRSRPKRKRQTNRLPNKIRCHTRTYRRNEEVGEISLKS